VTSPVRSVILLAAVSAALSGQRVLVVSEYQRIRPDGETVLADRIEHRREIISPAVARNAWTTFRIVVEAPPGKPYYIYVAQNPDDVVGIDVYQEEYTQQAGEWVPDKVKPVKLPVAATLAEGQKTQSYLLDVWVPDSAPVARFRLEVQVNANDRWIIYPLEVRVREAMAPAKAETTAAPQDYVCAAPATPRPKPDLTRVSGFVARNIAQDLMLARVRESAEPRDQIIAAILRAGGWNSTTELCAARAPAPRGVEWWLRVRDYLLQGVTVR
jgi:hypothetical protein